MGSDLMSVLLERLAGEPDSRQRQRARLAQPEALTRGPQPHSTTRRCG